MPSVAEILEREGGSVDLEPGDFERMLRRRAHKRRSERIRAATLAIILVAVTAFGLARTFGPRMRTGIPPAPRPVPAKVGTLAYALDGDIYAADADGSNAVRIANGRPPSDCGDGSSDGTGEYFSEGPIWSPDGRYLAYRHADCDGPRDAWWDVVISDPTGTAVTSFPSQGWGVSWSPDSTRVAVWVEWGHTIGIYGLDGERETLITLPRVLPAGELDPVWLPDGGSLLLAEWEIFLDGRPPLRIAWADAAVGLTEYSPDGSRIAFSTNRSLVVAGADGSDREEVFEGRTGDLAWSPSGDRIAFVTGDHSQLRLLDLATGRVTLLTEATEAEALAVTAGSPLGFSPDGDRVIFSTTNEAGSGWKASSLWSVNADGTGLRRLVAGTPLGDWLSSR